VSHPKQGTPARATGFTGPARRRRLSPTRGTRPDPLSLLRLYKQLAGGKYLPVHRFFPLVEVSTTATRRWLADGWLGHLPIPFA
jgi:hypothetical protein